MTNFLRLLFVTLNGRYNYAVLRNYELLPESFFSRDIDILISARQFKAFLTDFFSLVADCGIKIISVKKQHDITGVLLSDLERVIQIDLFRNVDILGIQFIDSEVLLERRTFNGKVYHLSDVDSLYVKMTYCFCFNEKLPMRYAKIYDALSRDQQHVLSERLRLIGCAAVSVDFGCPLLKRFIKNLFYQPAKTVISYSLSLYYRIHNRIGTPEIIVSFTGPDGCGKTTVISLLAEKLSVNPPVLLHFRPSLLPNLGEMGVKTGIKKDVDRNYSSPHRGEKHGKLNSLIRLCYYTLDYVFGYMVKVLPLRQRKRIIFFDRYYSDIVVDHERSGIFLGHKFLAWWRHFIPSCQYNFFFKVDPDIILARKQELTKEAIERIYNRMEYLASVDQNCYWINNDGTPEDAVRQMLTVIAERQHQKYAKKMCK